MDYIIGYIVLGISTAVLPPADVKINGKSKPSLVFMLRALAGLLWPVVLPLMIVGYLFTPPED